MMQRGFTLIEMMATLAVLGILMAIAVPSYLDMIDKQKLKDATETLYSSLQRARTVAKARSEDVFLSITVNSSTGAWCYGLNSGSSACDCTTANSCNLESIASSDIGHNFSSITVKSGNTLSGLKFDKIRGIVSGGSGELTFSSPRGKEATVKMSATGEITHCSAAGSTRIGDYPTC